MSITPSQRDEHRGWLLELTQIPTAAGREDRVAAWIRRWAGTRPEIALAADPYGNLVLSLPAAPRSARPVFFTAHMDHPAFVVERVLAPGVLELSFRGGVNEAYFHAARVAVVDARDRRHPGALTGKDPAAPGPFGRYLCELDDAGESVSVGDVAVWDLPAAEIRDGLVHTVACDDLAAAAAALAAFDVLRRTPRQDVRVLFTRAEEVGFVGAIASCRPGRPATMPMDARVIALENSRSFAESPIGGGAIVRVGDRMSVFSPTLTDAVARRADDVAAREKTAGRAWKWQRKLMAGGACEASVFCHAGYEATCVCLPLGNYHNMGDLAKVETGTHAGPARIEREFIALADFEGLVDILVACGDELPPAGRLAERFDKLWTERNFVLGN